MASEKQGVTQLLLAWNAGDPQALDALLPLVYDELRALARSYLRRERSDHTWQPTALVHEAYLRLVDQSSVTWQDRTHFFGIAARLMRQLLVNHALAKQSEKRGGLMQKVELDDAISFAAERNVDVLALEDALKSLEALDERQARLVELRFFAGLSIEETAAVLKLSPATIKREWNSAKLWLRHEISRHPAEGNTDESGDDA